MRVLFNTYPVAFGCPGGGEVQLLRCREALQRLSIEVELFDPWHPQFESVDLVHYFSVQGGSMNFCDYVKRIGLPLLISPVLWMTPANRRLFPLGEIRDLLHRCDRILPNSELESQQLAEEFELELEKFSAIPNGIDESFAEPADPRWFRQHFQIDEPFVLNVANLEPRKNQIMLARVARELGMNLVLIGRARDSDYRDEVLRAGGSRVRYLGWLDHDDPLLKSAYRACRLFALPSLLETPGLSALEAAAQGAKLLVTSVGSTTEYFDDLACYVDPLDEDSLRRGLQDAWSSPAEPRLRSHVLDRFTWDHAARALIDAYEQTLAATSAVR